METSAPEVFLPAWCRARPDMARCCWINRWKSCFTGITNGVLKSVPLPDKPPEIIVDHTYSDGDFSREAIKRLDGRSMLAIPTRPTRSCSSPGTIRPLCWWIRGPFPGVSGLSQDPEAAPIRCRPAGPADLNSLLIKSFVITAIKNPVTLVSRGLWMSAVRA